VLLVATKEVFQSRQSSVTVILEHPPPPSAEHLHPPRCTWHPRALAGWHARLQALCIYSCMYTATAEPVLWLRQPGRRGEACDPAFLHGWGSGSVRKGAF
jgi:hypothetical protein